MFIAKLIRYTLKTAVEIVVPIIENLRILVFWKMPAIPKQKAITDKTIIKKAINGIIINIPFSM